MTRTLVIRLLVGLAVVLLGVWIVRNTYFENTTIELPLQGEAADNERYAIEHLLKGVGVEVRKVNTLQPPPTHGVLLTNGRSHDSRRHDTEGLEAWVRAGGHLVVGAGSAYRPAFKKWTGLGERLESKETQPPEPAKGVLKLEPKTEVECRKMQLRAGGAPTEQEFCGRGPLLSSKTPPAWSLASDEGAIGLSVPVGKGWVTVLPVHYLYSNRELTRGDNARILLGALGVRRGDVLYLYDETEADGLLHLLWRLAAPGLVLLGLALLLLILRALPRFGTPIPAPVPLRRSLAEQVRATALFAWRARHLQALRRAVIRALDELAGREIASYRLLDSRRRAEVLAKTTGMDADILRSAMTADATGPAEVQRTAIATLQIARRRFMQRLSNQGIP